MLWPKPEICDIPWFDRDGMQNRTVFGRRGWKVRERIIPQFECNAINRAMEPIWQANNEMPETERRGRIHGLHRAIPSVHLVFSDHWMRQIAINIFRADAIPSYSISFERGSEQELHQDSAVFHCYPGHWLVGAWIALEDIHPDSGPLEVLTGSHREQFDWPNYPQTNLRTANLKLQKEYRNWVAEKAKKYPRETPILKQGDVLFWHANLFHGGSPIRDKTKTRRSLVVHYFSPGTNVADKIDGPFNWD